MRFLAPSSPLAIGTLVVVSALTPLPGSAQRVAVDIRFGTMPALYDNELDSGPIAGVGVTVPIAPALGVRADVSTSATGSMFDYRTESYTLGLEAQLAATRGRFPVRLHAAVGAGASHFRLERPDFDASLRFDASPRSPRRSVAPLDAAPPFGGASSWRPTVTGGLRLSVDVARRLGLFADASAAATRLPARVRQSNIPAVDAGTFVQLPVTAGLRVHF